MFSSGKKKTLCTTLRQFCKSRKTGTVSFVILLTSHTSDTHISALFCLIMDVRQLFKILEKEAECPLCLETVKNPKTLPCLHSFCLECLDKLANFARRQLQTSIKCPVCQTSFPIPNTDTFASLPSSFHLSR